MTKHFGHRMAKLSAAAALLACGVLIGRQQSTPVHAQDSDSSGRVFELRVYHTYPGKLPDLMKRFREHTVDIFQRHGMTSIAYWTPTDEPLKDKTLYYVLAFPSREAAKKSWSEFVSDPEWKKVSTASEVNGKLVEKVDSTFLTPTDFSAIK